MRRLLCLMAMSLLATSASAEELYTREEIEFLTHMIVHHEQALELTALVPARSKREDFIRFARYLGDAQQVEIEHMQGLLQQAADRGTQIPSPHLHGDPPMLGMLSKARMSAIAAASGTTFERLWLEGMIHHHEGALAMGRAQQESEFNNGRRPYGIDVLVDEILVVQRAEITKMKDWLSRLQKRAATSRPRSFVCEVRQGRAIPGGRCRACSKQRGDDVAGTQTQGEQYHGNQTVIKLVAGAGFGPSLRFRNRLV